MLNRNHRYHAESKCEGVTIGSGGDTGAGVDHDSMQSMEGNHGIMAANYALNIAIIMCVTIRISIAEGLQIIKKYEKFISIMLEQ